MEYIQLPWRESDQKVFVADISKAYNFIGWLPIVPVEEGINRILNWLQNKY